MLSCEKSGEPRILLRSPRLTMCSGYNAVTSPVALPEDFSVLAGDDLFIGSMMALGAVGGIVASAHVETAAFAALVDAWRDGRVAEGRLLGRRLAPVSRALFAEPNPAVIKGVLHAEGRIPSPHVRLPLTPLRDLRPRPRSKCSPREGPVGGLDSTA